MKTESLKELREAVRILTYTATDLSNAKDDIKNAIDRIKAALYMETPAPSGRFNQADFLADDPVRPVMCGYFHDGGYRVACDSHILAACAESYEAENEGKIIGKDGREVVGKYPNWRSVIPANEESERHEIDTGAVYDLLKREKAENKLRDKYDVRQIGIVRVGDACFKVSFFAKICKFMDHYGIKSIRTYGPRRAAKVTAEDGSVAIIMPCAGVTLPFMAGDGRTVSREIHPLDVWDDEKYTFLRLSF